MCVCVCVSPFIVNVLLSVTGNYVLNYLAAHPKLENFVSQALVQVGIIVHACVYVQICILYLILCNYFHLSSVDVQR